MTLAELREALSELSDSATVVVLVKGAPEDFEFNGEAEGSIGDVAYEHGEIVLTVEVAGA